MSQIIREPLDQSPADEQRRSKQAQEPLKDLFALGDAAQKRWRGELPKDLVTRIRGEHSDAIYEKLPDSR